jgi:hypothetical protein
MTFADARKLFFAYWWILPLALVLILVLNYVFCGGSGPTKKEQQIQSNIDQQKRSQRGYRKSGHEPGAGGEQCSEQYKSGCQ